MKLSPKNIATYPVIPRLGIFILILLTFWLPLALPVYLLSPDPNLTSILTLTVLYGEFLFLARWWAKEIHGERGLGAYGLIFGSRTLKYLANGLITGLTFTFALFLFSYLNGWLHFRSIGPDIIKIILEGALVGLAIGFAEETLFRGWLLYELEKDYRPNLSLGINATLFALLHFIKPLPEIIRTFPQFPALVILGVALGLAGRSARGNLGIPIGLHGGLVWGYYILNVGQLLRYTEKVPEWVTGIDNNPLAGILGISFLSLLTFIYYKKSCATG